MSSEDFRGANDKRTKDLLVNYALKKRGAPSMPVDCDRLNKYIEDNKFVVAYFGDETDSLF